MKLLDTDIFLHLQADNPRVRRRFEQESADELAITVVTRIEVLRARFDHLLKADTVQNLQIAQQRLDDTDELLSQWRVIGISGSVGAQVARLRQIKGIRRIGRADLLIASIALAYAATLVTRNVDDFQRIPDLAIENWFE
jgi:tRNA(fMet)-specific endonuclease VapC